MRTILVRGLVPLLTFVSVAAVAGCGGGGGGSTASDSSAGSVTTSSTAPLDRSPFCVAIRALEAFGTEASSGSGTPADVLAANARLARLIEQVAAGVPEGAPADVQSLIADYRALTQAISAAGGDTAAAFAALDASSTEVVARLSDASAHRESFAYFASHCGTAPPT